jgi:undecaprenyl phosphate-alpha-L-ara4FN deformylase
VIELSFRVDVDTWDGAVEGVPRLIELFKAANVRATWFASVGPDRWGRAVLRVLTRPGFLAKMIRTRAPSMYPFKTTLRGTLLPSRDFVELKPLLLTIEAAGHEVGLHAFDHVRWQDALHSMTKAEVERELAQGRDAFIRIFGRPPRSIAAPGWVATDDHLLAQETFGLAYASDCRGKAPFVPVIGDRELAIQVPVTLPTLDEELGRDGTTAESFAARIVERLVPDGLNVFTLHTEAEGRAYSRVLELIIEGARARGATFPTLGEVVERLDRKTLPRKAVRSGELAGRAGLIALETALP